MEVFDGNFWVEGRALQRGQSDEKPAAWDTHLFTHDPH